MSETSEVATKGFSTIKIAFPYYAAMKHAISLLIVKR